MARINSWNAYQLGWHVPDSGFTWIDNARCLELKSSVPEEKNTSHTYLAMLNHSTERIYNPFVDKPTLFIDFSKIDPSREGILRFANRYGWLGVERPLVSDTWSRTIGTDTPSIEQLRSTIPFVPYAVNYADRKANREYPSFLGEPLSVWSTNCGDMARAVWIWERIRNRDSGKLGQHIIWKEHSVAFHHQIVDGNRVPGKIDPKRAQAQAERIQRGEAKEQHGSFYRHIIANRDHIHPEQFAKMTFGDPYEPAKLLLLELVNKRLSGTVSPRLLFDESRKLRPFIIPHSLLSALWLQLFRAVTGERDFRRCEICNEWMDVTERSRSKRMHDQCSARERQRRSRERNQSRNR